MAADNLKVRLWVETTCSLCQDFFTDPVMLECGHSFCKDCILRHWGEPLRSASVCPQCQKKVKGKNLRPNGQLGNVVDIAKKLHDQAMVDAVLWGFCKQHQEPLRFCKELETPICTMCELIKKQKEHHDTFMETTAGQYKVRSPPGFKTREHHCEFSLHEEE